METVNIHEAKTHLSRLVDIDFSAVSVWEVAIKHATGKADFQVETHMFRQSLLDRG